jgi:hydroxypyruvate reductase
MTVIHELRAHAQDIFSAGLKSADPFAAVRQHVDINQERLIVAGRNYDLAGIRRILLVGCGKAAARMALALEQILGSRISAGVVVVKYGHGVTLQRSKVVEAGHPIPDQAGVDGARHVYDLVANATAMDLIFMVISGGGSALLPLPVEGLSLADKQHTTEVLLSSGARIQEVNALRKHLSKLKGGRLAKLADPAQVIALILSDVVGDELDAIASGPTVPDRTTFQDCLEILRRHCLEGKVVPAVLTYLQRGARGEVGETAKPGEEVFNQVQNVIVGSNRLALAAAHGRAQALGYRTHLLSSAIEGESRNVATSHIACLKEMLRYRPSADKPICLISGGETTVTIRGGGSGGRNQEFALAASIAAAGLENMVVLSAGTDGTDGPTEAAGGIIDGATVSRGAALGLDAGEFLARNDSYHFLRATRDLLITGPTFTNVMDLQIILAK